ncbi:MAG: HD domain-containing protein [Planctomycetes bacterium]|nr:HD domain-containing protein [Planctomycetota bacterium]
MTLPHVIRDPVHGYVRLGDDEIRGLDTPEVQRLRGISQLGLTDRVFPGARHTRFEHALGTLEVSSRIFEELRGRLGVAAILELLGLPDAVPEYEHLRAVARWASLLHDIGHAPFSHVTEELLPSGTDHETRTVELFESGEIGRVVRECGVALAEDVRAVLVGGPSLPRPLRFVREVLAGPLGADRMDYLLRDSHSTGVSYGVFDLSRVLHTLEPVECDEEPRVRLGIRRGGVLAAEGMLWARFSMFQQVYLHRTRRILDRHLNDFLRATLPGGTYPRDLDEYLKYDDARIWEHLRLAHEDGHAPGHRDAHRILRRAHHRSVDQELTSDDPNLLRGWLDQWRERVESEDPGADPITDLVLPHADADSGSTLPVIGAGGAVVPLENTSSLVGRFRLRPLGRLYVAPGHPVRPWP